MWPVDREAFAAYWKEGVTKADIDEPMRRYLDSLTRLENLPQGLRRLLVKSSVFWTTGFLPPEFRSMMRYEWSPAQQAKFDRLLKRYGRLEAKLPDSVRLFPFSALLWDMRRRVRKGIPLV
jgi:uncharacterized protein (DUF2236 family)